MQFGSFVAAAALFVLAPASTQAATTTYLYQGAQYSEVGTSGYSDAFAAGMSLYGSITLANALAPNSTTQVLNWSYDAMGDWTATVHADFQSASFADGISSYDIEATPGDYFPVSPGWSWFNLQLITDATGSIVDWVLGAGLATRYMMEQPSFWSDDGGDYAALSDGYWESWASSDTPGSWSVAGSGPSPALFSMAVVPLPAGALLLGSALLSLVLLANRRRRPATIAATAA